MGKFFFAFTCFICKLLVYAVENLNFYVSIFKAIHEGRQAARQIDLDLMGYSSLAGPAGIVRPQKNVPA